MITNVEDGPLMRVGYTECGERLYVPPHRHSTMQMLFSFEGNTHVSTDRGSYSAGPRHPVCIQPEVEHELEVRSMQRLFIVHMDAVLLPSAGEECQRFSISGLAMELIAFLATNVTDLPTEYRNCLESLLRLEISRACPQPDQIVMPSDKRAARVAKGILDNVGSKVTLKQWAAEVGACERTLSRIFEKQTGMTFRMWQRRCRLLKATEHLSEGRSVGEVATLVGYQSASAFISAFQDEYQITPGEYVKGRA